MTQEARILNYIEQNGSITSMDAFKDLGITCLATRISRIVRSGNNIVKEWESGKNRYGDNVRFIRYKKA